MTKTIEEIVKVFSENKGKKIHDVMELVNVTDEDFNAVFEALETSGTPNSNDTVISDSLIQNLRVIIKKNNVEKYMKDHYDAELLSWDYVPTKHLASHLGLFVIPYYSEMFSVILSGNMFGVYKQINAMRIENNTVLTP